MKDTLLEKAIKVIDSCKNDIHFDGAIRYVDNFKKFSTQKEYDFILTHLHKKLNSYNGN
jgi:hypothetical protein|tara:strand:- start:4275 stop:4451 length:177 start_codon:yes stop_codon:yes gene_type:complete